MSIQKCSKAERPPAPGSLSTTVSKTRTYRNRKIVMSSTRTTEPRGESPPLPSLRTDPVNEAAEWREPLREPPTSGLEQRGLELFHDEPRLESV